MTRAAQAGAFGAAAASYAAVRPGYPAAAVRWGLPASARTVLDLGAGTGKVSQVLAAFGLKVVAVEPDERMLAELRLALPGVSALPGTAEEIPLGASTVDAVLVGHAFHWFGPSALDEIARVLRPGGTLALLWNLRDDATAWVAEYGSLIALGARDSTRFPSPAPFSAHRALTEPVRRTFAHRQPMDRAGLLALAGTRGYVLALPQAQRRVLLGRVESLVDGHPQLAGRPVFDFPYVTEVWRAERRNGE